MSDTDDRPRGENPSDGTGRAENMAAGDGNRVVIDRVRELLRAHGRLAVPVDKLNDDSDLFAVGLTSLATVNLMLAVEEAFDIEFPDGALSRRTFESIGALSGVVVRIAEPGAIA